MNKYKNQKTIVNGISFDSKAEANRYLELKLLENLGFINELKLQPKFEIQAKYVNFKGEKIRAINYIADFCYLEHGVVVVEDVKGMETKEFKIKRKMFEFKYPEIDFRIIK